MNVSDEEHRQHLLGLLKILYGELLVYRAFVEFVTGIVGDTDAEEIMAQARLDPEVKKQTDAYFENFSVATPESMSNALDQKICEYLQQWQPKGKPN